MKLFYTLCTWVLILGVFFTLGTDAALAQDKSTAQGLVTTFSRFLTNIILPFLFSVAFLYFIFNIAKYLIIGGASETERKKGKQQAIYGIAAFVFLFSFWAVINIFVTGLDLTKNSTICLDYFKLMGEPCTVTSGTTFSGGGGGIGSGGGIGVGTGTGTGGVGTGDGTGTGTGVNTGSGTGGGGTGTGTGNGSTIGTGIGSGAPLSELIFGTGKDNSGFHRSLIVSTALNSTPNILAGASCIEGLNTLKLSAQVETTQAAYLYYQTSTGSKRWQNVTDRSSSNYIGYDRDVIDTILSSGATQIHLIHTHPAARTEAFGLVMSGHGPSTNDFKALCVLNDARITYLVVDEQGIWKTKHTNTTCPYQLSAQNKLPIIETYTALAALESSTRIDELTDYVVSPLTPALYKTYFTPINTANLNTQSLNELLTRSNPEQLAASTTVTYIATANSFCEGI